MPKQIGVAHHNAKLTEDDVRKIRALLATPCAGCGRALSQYDLGRQFGVSHVMIHKIATGRSWKQVP